MSIEPFNDNSILMMVDRSDHKIVEIDWRDSVAKKYGKMGNEKENEFYFPRLLRKVDEASFLVIDATEVMRMYSTAYKLMGKYFVYNLMHDFIVINKSVYANGIYVDEGKHRPCQVEFAIWLPS